MNCKTTRSVKSEIVSMNFNVSGKHTTVEIMKLCVADGKMLTASLNSSRT